MFMNKLSATLLAATLLSAPAFAQTTTPPTSTPAPAPKTAPAEKMAAPAALNLTQQQAGEWRASKMIGLDVYNGANEKIGDITEVLVDQSGKFTAVVVGVGGFLGMGQHDVAVPFDQIKFMNEPMRTSAAPAGAPANAPATTTNAPATANNPAATDRTATTGTVTSPAASTLPRAYPDHAVLDMTREQLKAAPAFKFGR